MWQYLLVAQAADWVVLTAGSSGYGNYRHQADVAHAYQIVKKHGIPEENIITLMYDDIAHSESNPFPGKLFNHPTDKGTPGIDNYAGLKIDYKGKDVTPKNFINVLTGEGDGKVLKSTAEDDVFIYFTDHGGAGIIAFPEDLLHKTELMGALEKMSQKKMFKNLVFYLEACESGSMFDDDKLKELNIYATTASNATESSWGYYCGQSGFGSSSVDGKNIGACLGDLYSIRWMEDTDADGKTMTETLLTQFNNVKKATTKSHVLQFGATDKYNSDEIAEFLGSKTTQDDANTVFEPFDESGAVRVRDMDLHFAYTRYEASDIGSRGEASAALELEISMRRAADAAFKSLVDHEYESSEERKAAYGGDLSAEHPECELAIHYAMRDCRGFDATSNYALGFQRVAVNMCADEKLGWAQNPRAAAQAAHAACAQHMLV